MRQDIRTSLTGALVSFEPVSQRGREFMANRASELPAWDAMPVIYRAAGQGLFVVDAASGLIAKAKD